MKRAQIGADCPYFKKQGDKGIVCEGLTARGSLLLNLGSRGARDRWLKKYCCRYAAGVRCPIGRLFDVSYADDGATVRPRAKAASGRRNVETDDKGAELCVVTVVSCERRVRAFLSGQSPELVLPNAKIYEWLFRNVTEGEAFLCELVPAGDSSGEIMRVTVRRRKSNGRYEPIGGKEWVIERAEPQSRGGRPV